MSNNIYLNRIKNLFEKKEFAFSASEKLIEKEEVDLLFKSDVAQNTIAILENNNFHAECYPSYIKYFIELGFNVHLFITKKNYQENSLVNCNFPEDKIKIFSFNKFPTCDKFFEYLLRYKYILLATLLCKTNVYYANLIKNNYVLKYKKDNLFCINHDVEADPENKTIEDFFSDKTFVLRDKITSGNKIYPFISPVYFGEYKNLIKHKSTDKIKFLCVGGNSEKRNFEELFTAIKKLINEKNYNFEIIFIGTIQDAIKELLTPELLPYIKITGRLTFNELFKYNCEADFLVFNVDKDTSAYDKYAKRGITGAYTTSLGFRLPGLIDQDLAQVYDFDDNMAICYDKGELYTAFQKALELPDNQYIFMQENLKNYSDNLQISSLNNMKGYFNV